MIPATLALLDAIVAVLLVAGGILAAHFELVLPFSGFRFFMVGFFLSLLGILVGLLGIVRTGAPERRIGRPRAIAGLLVCALIALPVVGIIVHTHDRPLMNDVTTDFQEPPSLAHAATLPANKGRNMTYDAARNEKLQREAYPAIKPLVLKLKPDQCFTLARQAAAKMPGWRITSEDPHALSFEGVATSCLFRFEDDFAVEVRPGSQGGCLVEMRSKSRVGKGDFGANARRIEALLGRVGRMAASAPAPAPKT